MNAHKEEYTMLVPSLWNDSLFNVFDNAFSDDFFNSKPLYDRRAQNVMKTDVRETGENYEVDVDLPGFKKEDISVQLQNGYLTIGATKKVNKEETDDKGNFLRRERFEGNCSRSFYVGEDVRKEDISAKLEDGILSLKFPKKTQKEMEESRMIAIQ